jgi:hypothetical protein
MFFFGYEYVTQRLIGTGNPRAGTAGKSDVIGLMHSD